jgi:hypothetical protein
MLDRLPATDTSDCKGYRWPASRLTSADMEKLTQLRALTGRPLTVLLHDAVSVLYDLMHAPTPPRPDAADAP